MQPQNRSLEIRDHHWYLLSAPPTLPHSAVSQDTIMPHSHVQHTGPHTTGPNAASPLLQSAQFTDLRSPQASESRGASTRSAQPCLQPLFTSPTSYKAQTYTPTRTTHIDEAMLVTKPIKPKPSPLQKEVDAGIRKQGGQHPVSTTLLAAIQPSSCIKHRPTRPLRPHTVTRAVHVIKPMPTPAEVGRCNAAGRTICSANTQHPDPLSDCTP